MQTPNPEEMIFAVFVNTDLITLTNKPVRERLAFGDLPYRAPTRFKDLDSVFRLQALCSKGVATWYFIGESIGLGKTTFYFFKDKTAEEMAVPYERKERLGDHPWPMVVYDIKIDSDYNFPISTNSSDGGVITGPTNYIKDIVDEEVEEGTLFVTEKFLTATQPPVIHHKVPIVDSFHVQVNGASREYRRVLHDDLAVDASRSGTEKTLNGATEAIGGSIGGLFFPKTNFTRRKPYVKLSEPERNAYGLWETTKVTVYPPKKQPPTIR